MRNFLIVAVLFVAFSALQETASAQVIITRRPVVRYYAPARVTVVPTTRYYAAPIATYYAPATTYAPVTSYYPAQASYYQPQTSYYAAPVTTSYAPAYRVYRPGILGLRLRPRLTVVSPY